MKFGFRIPSISKRIAARTSVKRIVKNELGLKAPRGYGWVTNPKKFVYNKVHNKTSTGCMLTLLLFIAIPLGLITDEQRLVEDM
jgi:hypothetical protein